MLITMEQGDITNLRRLSEILVSFYPLEYAQTLVKIIGLSYTSKDIVHSLQNPQRWYLVTLVNR